MNFGIEGLHYIALPLARKDVEGLLEIQEKHDGVCKGCAKGKNTKKTFPSRESKKKGILEIIHSDVCGQMSSSSLSGYLYCVSFIDDFLGRHGFTSSRTKMKYSTSSRNSNP